MNQEPTVESGPLIDVKGLQFRYGEHVVLDVDQCELGYGQNMAVVGPSGCGKTTLLHLLAGLLAPSSGVIRLFGQDLSKLHAAQLDRFRGRRIGLVFQRFHLMPALTVRENVAMAQRLARVPLDGPRIDALFERLNLSGLENHKPSMLSQGQAQRAAIARALVHRPQLVMADEPTSALDDEHARLTLRLLRDAADDAGAALLVVTHDQRVRGEFETEFELDTST